MRLANTRPAVVLLVAALLTASTSATVVADVDVEIGNGDVVTGTFAPADEIEVFRIRVPAGSTISVSAKGIKKKGEKRTTTVAPNLALLNALDTDLAAGRVKRKKTSAKLKKLRVPATGEYRVVVTGDGVNTGNYVVKVKWKEPKKTTVRGQIPGSGVFEATFPAGAGATASFKVKSPKGSTVDPSLESVQSGDGKFALGLGPGAPKVAKKIALPVTDDYTLVVKDGGVVGGAVSCTITTKQAKPSKRKISVTGDQIGAGGGQDFAFGSILGSGGGGFVLDDSGPPQIKGSGIDVPVNALVGDTVIVLGTAPEIFPPDPDVQGAGPTVFFGPEGQVFLVPVTLTIPFDLAVFGGDFTGLKVFGREADGTQFEVSPLLSVNQPPGTVSFQVSNFTAFRAFGPVGIPGPTAKPGDLDGDGFAEVAATGGNAGDSFEGAIFLFSGVGNLVNGVGTQDPSTATSTLTGTNPAERLGRGYATGDVNGDGIADAVSGVLGGADGDGEVHIFFGGTGVLPGGTADVRLAAPAGEALFGFSVAVGDVTGDGVDDVAVGSPAANGGAGSVAVWVGGIGLDSAQTPFAQFTGAADAGMGFSVAIGEVTGDQTADLVIGAPTDFDTNSVGRVYVFDGPLAPGLQGTTTALIELAGLQLRGNFGSQVAVGDHNGDGTGDVVVSAPAANTGLPTVVGAGQVYTFFGGANLDTRGAASADVFMDGAVTGQLVGEHLKVADVTGDQFAEIIVGAPTDNGSTSLVGAVFVFVGSANPTQFQSVATDAQVFRGEGMDNGFGGLQQPVDVNGDGVNELFVYAPRNSDGGMTSGKLYIFKGGAGFSGRSAEDADAIITGRAGDGLSADAE